MSSTFFSLSRLRVYSTALTIFSLFSAIAPTGVASAAPVYRETFQFCPRVASDKLRAANLVGWAAMRKGKGADDMGSLKSSSPGNVDIGSPFRSFPVGRITGNVLWTKPTTGLTIFTQEFSFVVGSISRVEYDQRLDGFSPIIAKRDATRLALLVDGVWYISDAVFRVTKRSVWEKVSIDLTTATFGTSGGSALVGPNAPANSGLSLPVNGSITAFGVFVPRVSNRVRIDNFALVNSSPDSSAGAADTVDEAPCVGSVSVIATPTATSTAASSPTESPTPTATAEPTPIAPTKIATPSPTSTPRPLFCSEPEIKALGNLKVPRKFSRVLVTTLPAKSLKGLRDRFLLAIILEKNLPLELLINAVVEDYDPSTGILRLPASARADGDFAAASKTVDFKLNRFTQLQGARYLKRYLKDGNRAKYLFPRVDRGTEQLIETALCSKQLRRLIRLRAEKAGFKIKFNRPS